MSDLCDNCGESIWTYSRHPKWERVSKGTVIPAGQPYRLEWNHGGRSGCSATELVTSTDYPVGGECGEVFRDSSWKPPLVLPTEPTWGMAITDGYPAPDVALFKVDDQGRLWDHNDGGYVSRTILDFIPLTDEQVARIEAAR